MDKSLDDWDNRRDREIRQAMSELKALEESGYFEGLGPAAAAPEDPDSRKNVETQVARSAPSCGGCRP